VGVSELMCWQGLITDDVLRAVLSSAAWCVVRVLSYYKQSRAELSSAARLGIHM